MHKPHTRVISPKPYRNPPACRHANGVSFDGINKVVFSRIRSRVEVSGALTDNIKVETMEVEWMVFGSENACALHHDLYGRVVW
ncbi:hypothetical protein HanIR_Chr08g0389441 [Helianthus annuus]|nr:hypothetical protein HanIR_Chr08g0389441 [Helianthus annuus]